MTTVDQSTLLRIKKLLEHSESAHTIGSSDEAATFAAKANELMLRHKLSLSDVQMAKEEEADPVTVGPMLDVTENLGGANAARFRRRSLWIEELAGALAKAHFCSFLISAKSKAIWIVGRKADREIVEYLLKVLAGRGWAMACTYYYQARREAKEQGFMPPSKPKESFLIGYVLGIHEKLREMRQQVVSEVGSKALVRFERNDKAVQQFIQEKYGHNKKVDALQMNIGDFKGFKRGHEAGKKESLHGGIKAPAGKKELVGK